VSHHYPAPPFALLKDAFDRCERRIEDRYGVGVSISDVLDPNTGDFNGVAIQLDYDQDLDAALFVLVHLFGHTAQWNTSDEYRRLGYDVSPGRSEEELTRIYAYERDATRISLALLHEVGVTTLDQWASDWWAADWKYLAHFYRTGEKLPFRALLAPGAERLTPLPIPEFTPQKWISRWAF
jgi:hypothetical protein